MIGKTYCVTLTHRAQKRDSRNGRIRTYAFFAKSVLFAKKYILRLFSEVKQPQNLLHLFFFRASRNLILLARRASC